MGKGNLPQHFRYINPILDVLREIGGSGKSSEVIDLVVEKLGITEEELAEAIKSGPSRVINQIHWARMVLVRVGCVDSAQHGFWRLTEKGMSQTFSEDELLLLYKQRKAWMKTSQKSKENVGEKPNTVDEDETEFIPEHRTVLLNTLKNLPPAGFERICQRLLRESGFEQVEVTGKSGDGGIDGIGLLEVNPLVSFKVLFQCKRYQGSVTPSQVRDFRGAMLGRADKGIIITTGTFTKDAKAEARRDGVPPIELVDGEKLAELFERHKLGIKPVTTYELDQRFFDEFSK